MSRGRFARFASFEDVDWSALGVGQYEGQLKRVVSGVGNRRFLMEWDSGTWWPFGGQALYYIGSVVTDINSTGLQTLAFPAVAHPANFFRSGLGMLAEIVAETSIAATARTFQLTLGAEDLVNLPTGTTRRVAGRFGFVADGAASGWSYIKKDTNEYDYVGASGGNATPLTLTWANALSLTGSASFTTAASAATAKLRRFRLSLVRG
jgi:hypothetical protein